MSFKREGNDKNLLGILRQRRIKDLLAVNIPEDEALLTSNGRLACIVCHHRPVFDTLEMLLVHRQGKKHAAGVAYQKQEKRELQQLILKRKHEQFIKDGTVNIQQETQLSEGKKLCLGQAYDSRCKKNKNPKVKVNLNSQQSSLPTATPVTELPGNRNSYHNNKVNSGVPYKHSEENCKMPKMKNKVSDHQTLDKESSYTAMLEKQRDGPVLHSHQLKKVFEKPFDGPIRVTPYQSKNFRVKTTDYQISSKFPVYTSTTILDSSQTEPCGRENKSMEQRNMALKHGAQPVVFNISSKGQHKPTGNHLHTEVKLKTSETLSDKRHLKMDKPSDDTHLKIEKAEKYLHYRGGGWKKDLFGNWVKDEDAEFDSDEEPPDLP